MIANLEFENFAVFEHLDLSLSPRVNVVIGSNGTGKTLLLKAIYGLGLMANGQYPDRSDDGFVASASGKFLRIFSTEGDRVGTLSSKRTRSQTRLRLVSADGSATEVTFGARSQYMDFSADTVTPKSANTPVYIPTKEVLSLVRGIRHPKHDRATVEMIFDDGYLNLAELLVKPGFGEKTSALLEDPRLSNVIRDLVALVGGRYRENNDGGFEFQPGQYEERAQSTSDGGEAKSRAQIAKAYQDSTATRFVSTDVDGFPTGMTAEGYRKIGVLHRLLCNGSINPGNTGTLLWDEPESNLIPKLMKKLVQVLLELSRNGQQIILATHDYVLLKWLDLLMDEGKEDHIRFHAIYQDSDTQKMSVESADSYALISKTAISDTFAELFDEDMARALEVTNT